MTKRHIGNVRYLNRTADVMTLKVVLFDEHGMDEHFFGTRHDFKVDRATGHVVGADLSEPRAKEALSLAKANKYIRRDLRKLGVNISAD